MATRVLRMESGRAGAGWLAYPERCFWIVALLVYGLSAVNFASGHFLDQTARDLWQHIAALRALIADPWTPANPFVPGNEGSRHFHPYWVTIALIARGLGWNAWQAIALAGFVSAATIAVGIYAFGRAFYRNRWGPLALLAAMVLSWSLPISHTGFHSPGTLIEGIAYPAALLVGLSLMLWALIIHALAKPRLAWLIVPLAALMFATHQLGAGIGFMAAACFILFWPHGSLMGRAACIAALGAGLLLACAWPYHNPFDAIAKTGNPVWTGGLRFYGGYMLIGAAFPSLIGLWGLMHPDFRREGRPVLAALILFAAIFAAGSAGFMIATRFIAPTIIMLHIGVGALLILLVPRWQALGKAVQLGLVGLAVAAIVSSAFLSLKSLAEERVISRKAGSAYAAALALTCDVPDRQPVAVYDVAVWPVVATGQRVSSVPWPEPMIDKLAQRQQDTERLFDPRLTRDERIALARRRGVNTLILDIRGPLRRRMPKGQLQILRAQSARQMVAGPFLRFDLED